MARRGRRDDRAAQHAAHRRPIVRYYRQAAEAIGADVPFVLQDYPLTFSVQMTPARDPAHRQREPGVRDAQARGLAGAGEDLDSCATSSATARCGSIAILCGNGGLFLDFEMERGADGANTGYCFPDMLCDVVRLSVEGRRDEAHDLFDAHLPLIRYEQQPGVGPGRAQVRADAPRASYVDGAAQTRSAAIRSRASGGRSPARATGAPRRQSPFARRVTLSILLVMLLLSR